MNISVPGVKVTVAHKNAYELVNSAEARIKELQRLAAEEVTCNNEVEKFLEQNLKDLAVKRAEWLSKRDQDTEAKQKELDELKTNRAQDLDKLTKLTDKYNEFEKVCKNDRKRREKQRKQAQQAVRDLAAAVKIQAWWRAMLVRHKMGPFKSGKKGKKGKGSKKKKKK